MVLPVVAGACRHGAGGWMGGPHLQVPARRVPVHQGPPPQRHAARLRSAAGERLEHVEAAARRRDAVGRLHLRPNDVVALVLVCRPGERERGSGRGGGTGTGAGVGVGMGEEWDLKVRGSGGKKNRRRSMKK